MRLRSLLLGGALLVGFVAGAQIYEPAKAKGGYVYRGAENPYYWKNRMPDAAYWQQDVEYKITAKMDEQDNRIDGAEELVYWNNSPDTLRYVYFHLYQNAFIKGSYLHDLEKAVKFNTRMGKKEAAGHGIELADITVGGQAARTELDNTIMKVYLQSPLMPGGKVVIKMNFKTYYDKGATRRRMQMYDAWGFKHYNGCQWFPKLCVYDRMHGWDTYQHLNKEFYGDFGIYDVTLDFPSNYIVEATGVLQNRSEVLPNDLREKLDVKNFANKKWNEPPSEIIPYIKDERKKWHFIGNNVHDFAFTADPSYRLGTAFWNGVECVAIVQEPHAAKWQNAAEYCAKIIETFSGQVGMYCYPKIVAADANDGMEYPMITMDGGADPGYRGLLVHEIGHNWFYGQVGSNETYRAAMDEGFTQFITATGLRAIDGDTLVSTPAKGKYRRKFAEPVLALDARVSAPYANAALNQQGPSINTHSNEFNNALHHEGGYGQVYYKTAAMLYNLEYVLGDSLFKAALHHYFEQWKFAHPYFEDFRASVINFTHVDLSWFFDQWFETTKTLDYGICGIKRLRGTDSFSIKFHRSGEMHMPIDFTVTSRNGTKQSYYIPNTAWFAKRTAATTLPKWYGWGKMNTTYTAHVQVPGGVKHVQIDTTYRFGDRDMVDNYRTKGHCVSPKAVKWKFDGGPNNVTDRRHYRMYARPDLWWNPLDGIKVGAHIEGDYLGLLNRIDATVWWNSHVGQLNKYKSPAGEGMYARYQPVNYSINYASPIVRHMPRLQIQINSRYLDGGMYHRGGFNWQMTDQDIVQLYGQSMWRSNASEYDYLIYRNEWTSSWVRPNTSLNLAWTHSYKYVHGNGRYTISLRAPILAGNRSPFNYSYAQLESVNYRTAAKFEIRTRVFGRYGMGTSFPYESMLFMAGANPEELMENKYTRSVGFIPDAWEGTSQYATNHFQQGGGLNLRGYAGYMAPDQRGNASLVSYKGRSGASASVEIGFENYMPWKPRHLRNWLHANVYVFGDAGIMELSNYSLPPFYNIRPTNMWSDVRVDAGLGFAFTVKSWGVFEKAKPLTLRIDLPFFLNRPAFNNAQYATVRYVIGINRTF